MKKADLEVGGEFAYAERGSKYSKARRVRIVAFGVPRKVWKDYRYRDVPDGILLAELDRETGEVLEWTDALGLRKGIVATARELLHPWAEQVAIEERAAARVQAASAARAEDEIWLRSVEERLGLEMDLKWANPTLRDRVVISRKAMEQIVERMDL